MGSIARLLQLTTEELRNTYTFINLLTRKHLNLF